VKRERSDRNADEEDRKPDAEDQTEPRCCLILCIRPSILFIRVPIASRAGAIYCPPTTPEEPPVSDQPQIPAQQPPAAPQQVQVPIDDAGMENVYVNFYRVSGNPDEVLLDLGMYSQIFTPAGPEPVKLKHRLVMNFVTAKKLAEVLRMVVARHEQAYGVVEVDPNRRLRITPQPRPQG
jgi:hypothetical protein